jgi:AcrR family transcriptional regulator
MSRRIPEQRLDHLVRTATEVLISQGYRRTQMADVAAALDVAKGTLYGYVESKDALFELCLRHADRPDPLAQPAVLPVRTPRRGELLRLLRKRLAAEGGLPVLSQALNRRRAPDARAELEEVLRELYSVMERHHRGIKLIDRCALDHPELAAEWQKGGRKGVRHLVAEYLASRIRANRLRPVADVQLAARFVIESIMTWAVHIKWDHFPERFDEKAAEDGVIEFLVRGLLKD